MLNAALLETVSVVNIQQYLPPTIEWLIGWRLAIRHGFSVLPKAAVPLGHARRLSLKAAVP